MYRRRWKTDNALLDSLPKYNKEKIESLVATLTKDDTNTKEELILQLLAVCRVVICSQTYRNNILHRNLQDLISTIITKTCEWVEILPEKKSSIKSIFGYYVQIVKNEIKRFNDGDTNPNVTGFCLNWQKQKGLTLPTRLPLNDDLLQINTSESLELPDILLTLAETEFEREIIILRYQNYTDNEIADKLNVTQQYICQIRRNLESRYDYYMKKLETQI